jgi:regulator of sirC expression with transglutaminase-like and TPR domain
MHYILILFNIFSAFILTTCTALEVSNSHLRNIYNRLDPKSVSQHLAFYELYSERSLGKQALNDAWKLLSGNPFNPPFFSPLFPSPSILKELMSLVNKPMDQKLSPLDPNTIGVIQKLTRHLQHYNLKGHHVWSEEEVLNLPLEEIDVSRGLFLSQFADDRLLIQSYEAYLDLIALQILAYLPSSAGPDEKIKAINSLIFDQMGFRFPPHSLYAKDIDVYTFLPSVLDSRRGVCLGVSVLYICLAQRLGLPLEIITPPGHIYIRCRYNEEIINIETTVRGIHIDCEEYLSLHVKSLQQRTVKEVIGCVHFNQASGYWQAGQHEKALNAYEKASFYMPNDIFLKELKGYVLLILKRKTEGEQILWEVKDTQPEHCLIKETIIDDYFAHRIDANGIQAIFTRVDDDRKSILAKKELLEKTLDRYPYFRAGLLHLAVTWLQLHRPGEALNILKKYDAIDPNNPEVHYYLSVLYCQRYYFALAWHHLQQAENILKAQQHSSKVLRELRKELLCICPE